jgi:hypothetical protein
MPEPRKFPQYLRRRQASQYLAEVWGLKYAESTLARLCCQGRGPKTSYDGRTALHTPEALDAFARSRITSTRARRDSRPVRLVQPEARA